MDPDECLKEIRILITNINSTNDPGTLALRAGELAELVEALDEWLSKGGFRPLEWGGKFDLRTDTPPRVLDTIHLVELSLQDSSPFPGAGEIKIIDDKETT